MAGPETIDPHGLKYGPAADFGSRKLHEKKKKEQELHLNWVKDLTLFRR